MVNWGEKQQPVDILHDGFPSWRLFDADWDAFIYASRLRIAMVR